MTDVSVLYSEDLPLEGFDTCDNEGQPLLARVLPRRCNDDQLGPCINGWYEPPVTTTRIMCGWCDGRGWLYPEEPTWFDSDDWGPLAVGYVSWTGFCLLLWHTFGFDVHKMTLG